MSVLAACGPQAHAPPAASEAWRADLRHLARELTLRHANAFHTTSQERFISEVTKLDAAMPELNDDQVLVELLRLVALVGDGHTHLDLPPSTPRFPVEFVWFGEELRVVAAAAPHHSALGARLLEIGGVPLDRVMESVSQLVPRGENEGRTQLTATRLLASSAVLHGLGLIPSLETGDFVVQADGGERVVLTFRPATAGQMADVRFAAEHLPLWLQSLGEGWWTEVLSDKTVYLSFSRYPPEEEFAERSAALGRLLDESKSPRLVIDLRRNEGGDRERFRRLLLPIIQSRPAIHRKQGLYAITGPGTFSAAQVNALDLRNEAHAILVGEPTGARPNAYREHGEFRLPHSGLRVSYSTQFFRSGADTDTAVMPDRLIEAAWEPFRSGRDPVMDWILAQPIPEGSGR